MTDKITHAKDCKCVVCGKQAEVFWPCFDPDIPSIHTIRTNFALWKKRIDEVAKGEAILSIRQWSGKPYRSKQVLLANLTAENGVGIQKLTFQPDRDGAFNFKYFDIDGHYADIKDIARHDGLSFEEWREWFKDCDLSQPLAVIHFTKFRY